jgi:hypothetical protein
MSDEYKDYLRRSARRANASVSDMRLLEEYLMAEEEDAAVGMIWALNEEIDE